MAVNALADTIVAGIMAKADTDGITEEVIKLVVVENVNKFNNNKAVSDLQSHIAQGKKKGTNGYIVFSTEHKQQMIQEHGEDGFKDRYVKAGGYSAYMSEQWKNVPEEAKKQYNQQAKVANAGIASTSTSITSKARQASLWTLYTKATKKAAEKTGQKSDMKEKGEAYKLLTPDSCAAYIREHLDATFEADIVVALANAKNKKK